MEFLSTTTNPLGIHDDLQREVAFYDVALEAVLEAKVLCHKAGIPFTRPDDFFAEMVKTDGTLLLDQLISSLRCKCINQYTIESNNISFVSFRRSHG